MSLLPPPLAAPIVDQGGALMTPWGAFFSALYDVVRPKSGTTAQRPTKGLYPGLVYFDTSLGVNGKPIWVNKTASGWVLADGTAA